MTHSEQNTPKKRKTVQNPDDTILCKEFLMCEDDQNGQWLSTLDLSLKDCSIYLDSDSRNYLGKD